MAASTKADPLGFRDRTAVCGIGITGLGSFPERTPLSLAVDAFKLALDDSGLDRSDIDGLIVLSYGADYDRFLEATGLEVSYAYQGWTHGRFVLPMIQHAALIVASGMAKNIAIVHGRRGRAYGQVADHELWRQGLGPHGESPAYGAVGPVFGAAASAARYLHTYNRTPDDLAPISISSRKHGARNPTAIRRQEITLDDYRNGRWIIEPLRIFDCCQNNDGGACLIITSAEAARDTRHKPVYLSGMQGFRAGRQDGSLSLPGLGIGQQDVFKYEPHDFPCYEMAGIERKDVNALSCYDAFSPMVIFALERFGFCKSGEGLDFVKGGRIEPGGELPVNSSGGLLSEGHIVGWNLFIEIVRQLRGECGERQLPDLRIIQHASFHGESIIFRN